MSLGARLATAPVIPVTSVAAVPFHTQSPVLPLASLPANRTSLPKTVMSVGFSPLAAAPATSSVALAPSHFQKPFLEPSKPLNRTSLPTTVMSVGSSPDVADTSCVPAPVVPFDIHKPRPLGS